MRTFSVNFGWKCNPSFEMQHVTSESAADKSVRKGNIMICLSSSFPNKFLTFANFPVILCSSLEFCFIITKGHHSAFQGLETWSVHLVVICAFVPEYGHNFISVCKFTAFTPPFIHLILSGLSFHWRWHMFPDSDRVAHRLGIKYCLFLPHCSYCCPPGRLSSSLCLSLIASTMELPDGTWRSKWAHQESHWSPPKSSVDWVD